MTQQTNTTGTSLRNLRRLAGLTLEDVAAQADTSVSYLSKVETGRYEPTRVYVAKVTAIIADTLAKTAA